MNRELLTWYKSLLPEQKQAINRRFRDAPVICRMLIFLENTIGDTFTTQAAVKAVYPEEYSTVPFPKLRNRFFKIRKELLTSDSGKNTQFSQSVSGAPEEILFIELREKVRSKNADTAMRGLKELASVCRDHNIFELYPQVLREWIYGLLLSNEHLKIKEILAELETANALQAAWNQMYLLYRQAYLIHQLNTDFDKVNEVLHKMQIIARKYAEWPRFKSAYIFTLITFETARSQTRAQVVGKHFKQIDDILNEYPEMPIFYYGASHRVQTVFQLDHFKILYNFLRGNFEDAYKSLINNWERIKSGAINRPLSENEYRNKIKLELSTGRAQEALNTVQELIHFQKTTGLHENIPLSYQEMAFIYIYTYPEVVPAKTSVLLKHLDQRLKQEIHNTGKTSRDYAETLITKAGLLLITGKYTDALKIIQMPESKAYYGKDDYEIISELYELPLEIKNSSQASAGKILDKYIKKVESKLGNSSDPIYQHLMSFVLRMAKSFKTKRAY